MDRPVSASDRLYDDDGFYPPRPSAWEPLLQQAWALVPELAARANATRQNRMVPAENMQALHGARLLRHYQLRAYGGDDLPWGIQFHIGRILAHGCPATAWVSTVVASQMQYASRFPDAAQREIFAEGPEVLMGNASPGIDVVFAPADGGHRLSGRWRFLSGADHVDWVLLPVSAIHDSKDGGYMVVVPRRAGVIEDTWFVTGLQGTGSKDIVLRDVFVPAHRTLPFPRFWAANPPGARPDDFFLCRRDIRGYVGSGIIGPVIGIAEAALKAYIDLTAKRVTAMSKRSVADSEVVQHRVAESAAEIRAARVTIEQQFTFLRICGETDRPLTEAMQIEVHRDRALAARLCLDAVDRLARHMGAMGIFADNPVHALHQDLRAAASQIAVNFDRHLVPYGQLALGLPAKPAL